MEAFSKQEQKFLRRQQKKEEQEKAKQRRKIKKLFSVVLVILIIGAGISGLWWYFSARPPLPESDIIARGGVHWHSEIRISILGKVQEMSANIGIGISHQPVHTHDADGVIHLEFSGLIKKDDIRLGKFFENWGKTFNKDCIFDKCNGPEGKLKMLVNGKENFEFENYLMKNGDKIEIIFE